MMMQQTINDDIHLSGVGIHSGKAVDCTIKPASVGEGICFLRTDLQQRIQVDPTAIGLSAVRATRLGPEESGVSTPEHLLAGLFLAGVTNAIIEVNAHECPILDGSALPVVQAIQHVGLRALEAPLPAIIINKEHHVSSKDASLSIRPYDGFSVSYQTNYPESFLGQQHVEWNQATDNGFDSIAPARTYGFTHEIEALHQQGLGLGGSMENVLVINSDGYVNDARFEDECPRHKLLDILGDFMILGRPIQGQIIAKQSGHQLNLDMVQQLYTHYIKSDETD